MVITCARSALNRMLSSDKTRFQAQESFFDCTLTLIAAW